MDGQALSAPGASGDLVTGVDADVRQTVFLGIESKGMPLIDASSVLFPLFLSLRSDGHAVKFVRIHRSYRTEQCVISPVVRAVDKS